MSNERLSEVIKNNINENKFKEITIVDVKFEDVVFKAKELIKNEDSRIFIARGSHAKLLNSYFENEISIVEVDLSVSDVIKHINFAHNNNNKVALITYKSKYEKFKELNELTGEYFDYYTFTSLNELEGLLNKLSNKGFDGVIGTSTICDLAENNNLDSYFIYSNDSIITAINDANEIALAREVEQRKTQEIKTIVKFIHNGVISVDKDGVIKFVNKSAKKLLELNLNDNLLTKNINEILPELKIDKIIKTGRKEINQIETINDQKVNVSKVPIIIKSKRKGAIVTLQKISDVKETELKIRKDNYGKGLVAKYNFENILGKNEKLLKCKEKARVYSQSNFNILITGETGTGKELLAQSIHNESTRRNKPFVPINCTSLPEKLLESELFGYEEGSFTGAQKGGKKGIFEIAHEGTVFLDEIGKISKKIQYRLLRVLEEKNIRKIGSDSIIPVDVRVIAATNNNLFEEIKKNNFQKDLYYRLKTLTLELPPLRERKEDIEIISKSYLKSKNVYLKYEDFWYNMFEYFKQLNWPGNVRQLENILQRIIIGLENNLFNKDDLQEVIDETIEISFELINENKDDFFKNIEVDNIKSKAEEKEIINNALEEEKWHKSKTAKKLGISRTTLWRKMKEHNLSD